MRQCAINQEKSPNNGHKIKIIFENRIERGTDIKAGDSDKTVKAKNTWEEHAMYTGRDSHYKGSTMTPGRKISWKIET